MQRNKENNHLVAKLMRDHAHEYYQQNLIVWKGDESMIEMFTDDYNHLQTMAHLIEEGSLGAAEDWARKLDTVVRDEIPNDVWEYIDIEQA